MKETNVIDDVVPQDFQNFIVQHVTKGKWSFVNDMSYNNSEFPSYGFNQLFKHPQHGIVSPLYEAICVPIINAALETTSIKIDDIYHARSFLQLPLDDKFIKQHNGVHVDLPTAHLACVYYVDDSDGDTIIYEQTTENTKFGATDVQLIEHQRVSPKKGRMVIFDGTRYHCSSQPRTKYRCIINFNLI